MAEIFSRWGEHGPRPAPLDANADLFASIVIQESVDVECTPQAAWQLIFRRRAATPAKAAVLAPYAAAGR